MSSTVIRTAVFGSFYRGYFLLDELVHGAHRRHFEVVGVATDDPSQSFISRDKRVWQYPHSPTEAGMVETQARLLGIPVYTGRVKSPEFYEMYENHWRPHLCISGTFGQKIDARLFDFPVHGFFNTHPCQDGPWPSPYAGPNPFAMLMADGRDHTTVALHRVDAGLDTGELIAMSERIAIPPGVSVVDMHKITAPVIAKFAVGRLLEMLGQAQGIPG